MDKEWAEKYRKKLGDIEYFFREEGEEEVADLLDDAIKKIDEKL